MNSTHDKCNSSKLAARSSLECDFSQAKTVFIASAKPSKQRSSGFNAHSAVWFKALWNLHLMTSLHCGRRFANMFSVFLVITGPVTVPMVSQSGSPPIPMPVQVPPGHVMQQIVDENGTLRHVILSTQHQQLQGGVQGVQHHIHGHYVSRKRRKKNFPRAGREANKSFRPTAPCY